MSRSHSLDQTLGRLLSDRGRVFVQGCSTESPLWPEALKRVAAELGELVFTGIFVPGLNRHTYLPRSDSRVETFFMTPELSRAGRSVTFFPFCYEDALLRLRSVPIDAALFSVSPPDENGMCSFGPVVDFLADIWTRIPVRIAHINPRIPATRGHAGIPWSELTAYAEGDEPLLSMGEQSDLIAERIGANIAEYVDDGSTVQVGLGKIPGAALTALRSHRNLHIHSGLIGDAVLDLLASGALAPGASITVGVAIGSQRLYDEVAREEFSFRPVSYTHSAQIISSIPKFVSINSAMAVDLFGQAFAESTGVGFISGPGGASDFARAGRLSGGLRIVALPASTRGRSRIVLPGRSPGPVSLGRFDIDLVVTEYGAADLRGQDLDERATALIAIAAPEDREALQRGWAEVVKSG